MPMEHRYPLELDLSEVHCLIAGMGSVGQRKLTRILHFGPRLVSVFDPYRDAPPCTNARVVFFKRTLSEQDIQSADIVFACTADPEENRRIARLCRECKTLCNCVSDPWAGTVSLPACIDTDTLTLTLSTHGASPAFAKKWRQELEVWAAKKTATLHFMSRLRPLVLALGQPSEENTRLFRALAESSLEDFLASADHAGAAALLYNILPPSLHEKLPELLHDVT